MKSLLFLMTICVLLNACKGSASSSDAAPTASNAELTVDSGFEPETELFVYNQNILGLRGIDTSRTQANNWGFRGADHTIGELIVDSGFEPGTELFVYNQNILGLRGIDTSRTQANNWGFHGADHTIGDFYFKLEENASTNDRYAEIVRDPLDPSNSVVSMFLRNPTEVDPTKGRIQMEIGENWRLTDASISYRLFLGEAYAGLKDYTFKSGDWLNLMELWGEPDVPASEQYPFRISLYIIKSLDNTQLEYGLRAEKIDRSTPSSGQEPWQVVWEQRSKAGTVPIGEWVDVEVYYHEGDAVTGRYYLSVKRQNARKVVVFDVHNVTRHPLDPTPSGLRWINPVKIYCSEGVLKHLSDKGQTLSLMLDDFKFRKNKSQ